MADYTFKIWASDSDFCNGVIDECVPHELTLTDNSNSVPFMVSQNPRSQTECPFLKSQFSKG